MPILYSNDTMHSEVICIGEFILVDLEFTAWEDSLRTSWASETQFREIVNIGAVRACIDTGTIKILDKFDVIVTPKINPKVSEYFIALTGINNEEISKGISFEDALGRLVSFIGNTKYLYANGSDYSVLVENMMINLLKTTCPKIFSIRRYLSKYLELESKDTISSELYKFTRFSSTLNLKSHRGVDDCLSILAAIAHIQNKNLVYELFF